MYNKIPVYCLHLVENKDRLLSINNLLNNYDIFHDMHICEFTKLPKINEYISTLFNSLHTNYYDYIKVNYGKVFSCSYNWLQIIKCAYERGDEYALFCEDDINITVDNNTFNNIIESIPEDADLCKFWWQNTEWCEKTFEKTLHLEYFDKIKLLKDGEGSISTGNVLFFLSRKGMKYYIDSMDKDFTVADLVFKIDANEHLNMYLINKNIISFTSITNFTSM